MFTTRTTMAAYVRARLGTTERGASLVEYALLVALIAVICIAVIAFLDAESEPASSTGGN